MNKRTMIVSLCMLCALLASACASQTASASTGTTGFTCVKEEVSGPRSGEHCLTSGGTGKYKHAAIQQDTRTEATVTNETTGGTRQPLIMKVTVGGVSFTGEVKLINGVGFLENKLAASGEHYVTGTDMFPVEEASGSGGCKVISSGTGGTGGGGGEVEGTVILNVLNATTEGQGDAVKFSPAGEGGLATFKLGSCAAGGLNGTYTITGSVKCIPEGATCKFTHAATTGANTLKMGGLKVGLEGSLTFKAGASNTPISPTTVET